mmetsp:Transcript_2187/g.2523  ORF Transcript_2187/g.2523 Transcript_2187/m.2523 type:complete len:88 (-) Transcript_2187:40-303(-)
MEMVMETDPTQLISKDTDTSRFNKKYHGLNQVIATLLEDFSLIRFVPLDITDEESIERVMNEIDMLVQYKEFASPDDAIYNQQDSEM